MATIVKHIEYDYNGYRQMMKELVKNYPFLKEEVIGKTVFGRDIVALKIESERKEYSLYTAAIHGSERITATVLMKYIENLCQALKDGAKLSGIDARKALIGKGVIFVPLCNPDGCEISLKGELGCGPHATRIKKLCGSDFEHWNANLRGVDLNHNFDAGWQRLHNLEQKLGYIGPGPTRYGGHRPESEPETIALTNLCRNKKIRVLYCFHSQGEVIYWDYNGIETARGQKMAEIFAASSLYSIEVPVGIATGGGFKDWFIETYHRPGFTIELGKGKNPLPAETGSHIYNQIEEMMTIGLLM